MTPAQFMLSLLVIDFPIKKSSPQRTHWKSSKSIAVSRHQSNGKQHAKKIRVYYYLRGPIDLTKMFSAAAAPFYGAAQFINRKVLSGAAASASFGTFRCAQQQQQQQQAESEHPLWQHHVRMKHRWAAIKKDVGTVNFLQFFFSR